MDANHKPTPTTGKGNKKLRTDDPKPGPHEHLVEYRGEADQKLHDALDQKIYSELDKKVEAWFQEFQQDIGDHKRHPWKWLTGLTLFIFLGLNGFLYYQQAQQIQQLNNLVEQLTPATQLEPSSELGEQVKP